MEELSRFSQCQNAKTGLVNFWSVYHSFFLIFMFQIEHFQKILEGKCHNKNRLRAPLYILLDLPQTFSINKNLKEGKPSNKLLRFYQYIGRVIKRIFPHNNNFLGGFPEPVKSINYEKLSFQYTHKHFLKVNA